MMQLSDQHAMLESVLYRFSIAKFDHLCEAGLFADHYVELIDGLIIKVAPTNDLHYRWLGALSDELFIALRGKAHISQQAQLKLEVSNTKPMPDFTVIPLERYSGNVPDPSEAATVIEISYITLDFNKGIKLQRYAQAGVKEYWVIDAKASKLEVYREPQGMEYRSKQTFDAGSSAAMLEFPDVQVKWWL